MPKLVILTGGREGDDFPIEDAPVNIGREKDNDIVLPDERVSRHHARIFRKGTKYIVEDLGSANGVLVNGRDIGQESPLKIGDELTMGGVTAKFVPLDDADTGKRELGETQVRILSKEESRDVPTIEAKANPRSAQDRTTDFANIPPEKLQQAYERLTILYRISHELGSMVEIDHVLKKILQIVLELIRADRGFIMLADKSGGLSLRATHQRDGMPKEEISVSQTLIDHVRERSEAILISDTSQDQRFKQAESIITHDVRSTMVVPVKYKDSLLGVMHVDTKGKVARFTSEDLDLLTAICDQAAVAIENARLFADLKEQQRQLIEAEKLSAIGQLAGGVAHEINNPMTCILGYSELASGELKKKDLDAKSIEECAGYLKVVIDEAHRCQRIAQTLLQFGRRKKEQAVSSDINEIIKTALAVAQFHIKKVKIEIKEDLAGELPKITVDPGQLQQVFLNMIINARDAMEQGGELTIGSRQQEDHIEIRFSDTGCGIPEDKIEEIFKPLFTTKEEGKGTGLGLSVSRDIVERHNGSLQVESELGKGTTFIISLPVKDGLKIEQRNS